MYFCTTTFPTRGTHHKWTLRYCLLQQPVCRQCDSIPYTKVNKSNLSNVGHTEIRVAANKTVATYFLCIGYEQTYFKNYAETLSCALMKIPNELTNWLIQLKKHDKEDILPTTSLKPYNGKHSWIITNR